MVVFALCGSAFATPADSLWVANGTNVVEFGPGQLHGVRNTKPQAVLNSPAFASTQGVVFDGKGDLWVIDGGVTTPSVVAPALDMFTPSQLKALHKKKSSSPAPAVQITSSVSATGGFRRCWQSVGQRQREWRNRLGRLRFRGRSTDRDGLGHAQRNDTVEPSV